MNALTHRANYRTESNWIDWLLLIVLLALPAITCYAFFAPIF